MVGVFRELIFTSVGIKETRSRLLIIIIINVEFIIVIWWYKSIVRIVLILFGALLTAIEFLKWLSTILRCFRWLSINGRIEWNIVLIIIFDIFVVLLRIYVAGVIFMFCRWNFCRSIFIILVRRLFMNRR